MPSTAHSQPSPMARVSGEASPSTPAQLRWLLYDAYCQIQSPSPYSLHTTSPSIHPLLSTRALTVVSREPSRNPTTAMAALADVDGRTDEGHGVLHRPGGYPLGRHLLVHLQPPPLTPRSPLRSSSPRSTTRPTRFCITHSFWYVCMCGFLIVDCDRYCGWDMDTDVLRREDMPHRALQAAMGQELPVVWARARSLPRARAMARCRGAHPG